MNELNLKEMKKEELEELKRRIEEELKSRENGDNKEYEFWFEYSNDPRKGVPYAAKIVMVDGKLERQFFDLDKDYGKKIVTVSGEFIAKEGDIIEMRIGGSWKNDYRYLYYVHNGELIRYGDSTYSPDIVKTKKFLKGIIDTKELLGDRYDEIFGKEV